MFEITSEQITRFLEKVDIPADKGLCWTWMGAKNPKGYGKFFLYTRSDGTSRFLSTHRTAWCIFVGALPEDAHVLHRCDNPSCVNPDHLFLGTHGDNMRDMYSKGRWHGKKVLCQRGHVLTRGPKGNPVCRECERIRYRENRQKAVPPEFCKHGHRLDDVNLKFAPNGKWGCRLCHRVAVARHRKKNS